ncbi:hypothetical protein I3842_09G195100 [Carya illinoinensis]|uniref:Uncharacterized protein n=1 Tax=Carya illinoinensis TaxID=32201 RepID=A0A922J8W1_CARIL|nr:hypothetical protein I3842_09G195100 [Carya illinoinensis]
MWATISIHGLLRPRLSPLTKYSFLKNVRVTKRYTKWGSLGDSSVQNHEVAIYS